jgi:hypothetical protein
MEEADIDARMRARSDELRANEQAEIAQLNEDLVNERKRFSEADAIATAEDVKATAAREALKAEENHEGAERLREDIHTHTLRSAAAEREWRAALEAVKTIQDKMRYLQSRAADTRPPPTRRTGSEADQRWTHERRDAPTESTTSVEEGEKYTITALAKPPDFPKNGSVLQFLQSVEGWQKANDDPLLKGAIPRSHRGYVLLSALREQLKQKSLPIQFSSILIEEVMPLYGTPIETVLEKVSEACGEQAAEDLVKHMHDLIKKRVTGTKIQTYLTEFTIAEARYNEFSGQGKLPQSFIGTLLEAQLNLNTPGSQSLAVEVRKTRKEKPGTMIAMLASHQSSFAVIEAEERAMASSGANRFGKSRATQFATSVSSKVGAQDGYDGEKIRSSYASAAGVSKAPRWHRGKNRQPSLRIIAGKL